MKGSQKKWQSNSTESVIGMLMGFDELPKPQLVPGKTRVLSESYLHKVASISLRPGSSVSIGHSCSTNDGVKGVSRSRSSNVLDKCVNSSSINVRSSETSLESSSASVSPLFSKKTEHCPARRVLRRHQKLEHDSVGNSSDLLFDMKDKPNSCVACTPSMSRDSPPEQRRRSKFEDLLKAECKGYSHDPHLDQSSLANKSRKKYFERRKTAKKGQNFGVSEMPRNLDMRLCTNGSSYNNFDAYIQGIQDKIDNCFENDDRRKKIELRNPNSSISTLAAQYTHDASYDGEEAFNSEDFTRINGDPLLKSYPGISLEEGMHSSNIEEVVSSEASLNELSEEDSAYSKCSGIGPSVSLENLKRTSQHSPDSVLESHDTNNPPPFECFDSIGLMLQLQALNFELEEALSEESAMIVSGDEDFEELFGDLSHDGRKIKRWLGDEESRSFSYLVDVLDEAGFYDSSSFMDFNKWASLECPISPLVFDALDKKYGKQTSWLKSERLLLFDRINSGLLDIHYPFIKFHDGAISLRKKLCTSFRRDELWTMLTSQENEKSKDLSEKALDKWWDFKEGVSIICEELEASLFDELVMELTSF